MTQKTFSLSFTAPKFKTIIIKQYWYINFLNDFNYVILSRHKFWQNFTKFLTQLHNLQYAMCDSGTYFISALKILSSGFHQAAAVSINFFSWGIIKSINEGFFNDNLRRVFVIRLLMIKFWWYLQYFLYFASVPLTLHYFTVMIMNEFLIIAPKHGVVNEFSVISFINRLQFMLLRIFIHFTAVDNSKFSHSRIRISLIKEEINRTVIFMIRMVYPMQE